MARMVLVLAGLLAATNSFAASYVVMGVGISLYTQSRAESNAHMIQSDFGIYQGADHPWCGKRAYIDFQDKELFETALAASQSKRKVNLIYDDAAPYRHVAGHAVINCKVISIF